LKTRRVDFVLADCLSYGRPGMSQKNRKDSTMKKSNSKDGSKSMVAEDGHVVYYKIASVEADSKRGQKTDLNLVKAMQEAGFINMTGYNEGKSFRANASDSCVTVLKIIEGQSSKRSFELVQMNSGNVIDKGAVGYLERGGDFRSESYSAFCPGEIGLWSFICEKTSAALGESSVLDEAPPSEEYPQEIQGLKLTEINVSEIAEFQPEGIFKSQPRQIFDDESLGRLAQSLEASSQKELITVQPLTGIPGKKWELVNGERRVRAAQKNGKKTLLALVDSRPKTKKEQHLDALAKNYSSELLSPMEESDALQVQIDAGETQVSLARILGKHQSTIGRTLALQKLHPDLKRLLNPSTPEKERISTVNGYALSHILPVEKQLDVWACAKKAGTAAQVTAKIWERGGESMPNVTAARKRRNPNAVSKTVQRRLNAFVKSGIDLASVTDGEWITYLTVQTGVQNEREEEEQLRETVANVNTIVRKICTARTKVRSILKEAA